MSCLCGNETEWYGRKARPSSNLGHSAIFLAYKHLVKIRMLIFFAKKRTISASCDIIMFNNSNGAVNLCCDGVELPGTLGERENSITFC